MESSPHPPAGPRLPRWRTWAGGIVLVAVTPVTWVALAIWFFLVSVYSSGGIQAWQLVLLLLGACVPVAVGVALLDLRPQPRHVVGCLTVLALLVGAAVVFVRWQDRQLVQDSTPVYAQGPCPLDEEESAAVAAVLVAVSGLDAAAVRADMGGDADCVYTTRSNGTVRESIARATAALEAHGYSVLSPTDVATGAEAYLRASSGTRVIRVIVVSVPPKPDRHSTDLVLTEVAFE